MTQDYRAGRRGIEHLGIVRRLRRDSTEAEQKLWQRIRASQADGARFRRQHEFGPYVLDFYCPTHRLAIEVDGGQHFEQDGAEKDYARDQYLASCGIRVLRFTNLEVFNEIQGVLDRIQQAIEETPSPQPSPRGRGGRPPGRSIAATSLNPSGGI